MLITERTPQTTDNSFAKAMLYREFSAEREEILKHKWIESQKAGHDVGFEYALTDWVINHRAAWRKSRRSTNSRELQPG
jgi:hypothetical protein